ncbi:MAG: 50S ribosomal protein L29 [Spirochaetales bacterium]|nr:50S ribosomal protein L29 [Spirochaetales bacterium]
MKNSFDDLTYTELVNRKEELHKKYLELRMDKVLGHLDNPLSLRIVRRNIARVNTIIHEYALGIRENKQ